MRKCKASCWLLQALLFWVGTSGAQGQLVINEIMADNRTAFENGDDFPDYIELLNQGGSTLNLGGMSLSDDNNDRLKFVFPPNTLLGPGSCLVVFADSNTNSPGIHTGFGLDNQGEVLALYSAGQAVLDALVFGLQLPDRSIGRIPDGTGPWTLTAATPGDPNEAVPLGGVTQLRFNEWMALKTDSQGNTEDDWFEIYNATNLPVLIGGLFLSDNSTNHMVVALSFIDALGFVEFTADDDAGAGADHVPFKLSSSNGETVRIYDRDGFTVLEQVTFPGQQANVSQGRLPDGAPPPFASFPDPRDSPGESNALLINNVWINELISHTDPPLEDALELYNPTSTPVDISHWRISDDPSDPFRFRVPAGTVIAPFGFKVFYERDFNASGSGVPPHFTFNSFEGDDVNLFAADAGGNLTGFILRQSFGPSLNGVSFGRVQTSEGKDFVAMSHRSFGRDNPLTLPEFRLGTGQSNPAPKVGPIVISEIMYRPPDILVGTNATDNSQDEYVELCNITSLPVPLFDPSFPTNTWRIKEGINYRFPQNVTLGAGKSLVLVNFDPVTNAVQLAAFRNRYRIGDPVPIYGPYRGKLSNSGEGIELVRPDTPQMSGPSFGLVPYVTAERVRYNDKPPWPVAADGGGPALERITLEAYGNDPLNWAAVAPSPGGQNSEITSARYLNGTFTLRFQASPGASYSVLYRAKPNEGDWVVLNQVAAEDQTRVVEVQDAGAGGVASRFYRLVSPAQ